MKKINLEVFEKNKIFELKYKDLKQVEYELNIPVQLCSKESTEELAARISRHHDIPSFVTQGMKQKIKEFTENLRKQKENCNASIMLDHLKNNSEETGKISFNVSDKYKNCWMKFAKANFCEKKEFAQCYHYLIHSSAMMSLLQVEKIFQEVITRIININNMEMNTLQERQQHEMARVCENVGFAYTQKDVVNVNLRHVTEIERLQTKFKQTYESMSEDKRNSFRSVIIQLAAEMKKNNNEIPSDSVSFAKLKSYICSSEDFLELNPLQVSIANSPLVSNYTSKEELEESFTVNLGNQLKIMHNIRLHATNLLNYCRFTERKEMEAQQTQTVMTLYSETLSAVILITDDQLGFYSDLRTICNQTEELHFDSFAKQVDIIKDYVRCSKKVQLYPENVSETEETSIKLDEGDIFITRHSNLSRCHLIFHILCNQQQISFNRNKQSRVTSRHSVYQSIRYALRIATEHEVTSLTIPLLLTLDDVSNNNENNKDYHQWALRRAELVMKWMKGFMIEMASWDGGVSRNINFVLPSGIPEKTFDAIRSNLPEVFRVTSIRDLTKT